MCKKEKNINKLKILLANEATKFFMEKLLLRKQMQTAKETFEDWGIRIWFPEIKIKIIEIKRFKINRFFVRNNKITFHLKSEVRRAISNKGFKINNLPVSDVKNIS